MDTASRGEDAASFEDFAYDGPTLTLVVNPSAGRGRAGRLLPDVCSELLTSRPDIHLRVHRSISYEDARLRCIQAVGRARPAQPGRAPDSLVVMGGDGMAHLGLNACADTEVPLGVIPAGTGNDFSRGFGLSTRVAKAVQAIVAGRTRRVDLGMVTGDLRGGAERRYVGSVLSTGYDARVNRRTNGMPSRLGGLAYGWAAVAELAAFEPLTYRLEVDGQSMELPAMFIAIGNGGWFGGGMHICPQARVDDGLLDLTVIHPLSRASMLRLLPQVHSGSFVRDPAVELITARRVRVEGEGLFGMGDGEELGPVPLDFAVRPNSLTLIG